MIRPGQKALISTHLDADGPRGGALAREAAPAGQGAPPRCGTRGAGAVSGAAQPTPFGTQRRRLDAARRTKYVQGTILKHRDAIEFALCGPRIQGQRSRRPSPRPSSALEREGESLPQLAQLQELVARLLEQTGGEVLEADQRYTNQLINTARLRASNRTR